MHRCYVHDPHTLDPAQVEGTETPLLSAPVRPARPPISAALHLALMVAPDMRVGYDAHLVSYCAAATCAVAVAVVSAAHMVAMALARVRLPRAAL